MKRRRSFRLSSGSWRAIRRSRHLLLLRLLQLRRNRTTRVDGGILIAGFRSGIFKSSSHVLL
ncbi:MAG: hypothetical protein ACK55Z_27215, partial [bacterium]